MKKEVLVQEFLCFIQTQNEKLGLTYYCFWSASTRYWLGLKCSISISCCSPLFMRTWLISKLGVLWGANRMSSCVELRCVLNISGVMSPPRWSSLPVARWQVPKTFSSWISAPETGRTWVPNPSSPNVPVTGSSRSFLLCSSIVDWFPSINDVL